MKKVLFAVLAIAMVFVSCKRGNEAKNLSISMEIAKQPTVAGVTIKCTPSDTTIYYSVTCVPSNMVSQFNIDSMSALVYEACAEYGFENVAMQGVCNVVFDGELDPSTKYTPVAFQIDKKNKIYKTLFYGPEFTTKALPVSNMKIDITYDGSNTVTFTPDNNTDSYIAVIVDSALLYYWELQEVGYTPELADAVLDVYAYDPEHECTFTGATTKDVSKCLYGDAVLGDNIFAIAAPVYESHINGDKATKVLTLGINPDAPSAPMAKPRDLRRSAFRIAHK